jgi:hypothetical protein
VIQVFTNPVPLAPSALRLISGLPISVHKDEGPVCLVTMQLPSATQTVSVVLLPKVKYRRHHVLPTFFRNKISTKISNPYLIFSYVP